MNNPKRDARIAELLHAAAELPAAEVSSFLARECAGDPALRADVEAALAAGRRNASFLEPPVMPRSDDEQFDGSTQLNVGPASDQSPGFYESAHIPKIDGYLITGVLGHGGMGIVYRAVQTKLNRAVALKVLPAIIGSASPSAVTRFKREATSAARLHHTNIVPIYDFGQTHDTYYYAMELIAGRPLNSLIKEFAAHNVAIAGSARLATVIQQCLTGESGGQTLPTGDSSDVTPGTSHTRGRPYFHQVARWIADAADALHYAHGQGIVHRDIKPANLILATDRRIMITDFGLAKSSEEASVTITGSLIGTIRYISPEQAMAKRVPVDHRTDIYSLGATMYELLCFQPAFPGHDDKEVLAAIIARDPVRPRKIMPSVPIELETICLKTLEKLPDARYETARDLAEDLRRFLKDLPIVAKPPGLVSRSLKFAKRHRALATATIAVILLTASSAIMWRLKERGRADQLERITSDAMLFENKRNWSDASRSWRQALEIDSENPFVLSRLARSLQELHDRLEESDPALVAEAIMFCEKSRSLRPDPKLENLYGVLLTMGGRYEQALQVFKKELALDEKAPWAWLNIAGVHFLQKNDDGVRTALAKSIEKPMLNNEPYCYGHREMATFLLLHKDAAALDALKQAEICEGKPFSHFTYHLVRARVLLVLGSTQDAVQAKYAAESASSLWSERDRYIERYLSLAYLRNDEPAKALDAAKRAQGVGDLPVYANLLIAFAQAKLGNRELAARAFKEADAAWPDDLREPGSIRRSLHLGFLWFESADELYALRHEVESVLSASAGGH